MWVWPVLGALINSVSNIATCQPISHGCWFYLFKCQPMVGIYLHTKFSPTLPYGFVNKQRLNGDNRTFTSIIMHHNYHIDGVDRDENPASREGPTQLGEQRVVWVMKPQSGYRVICNVFYLPVYKIVRCSFIQTDQFCPSIEYPGRWRGGQTGRNSAWPWCDVGLPVEYAGSYQQDCFGLLLPSPQDSTTSTLLGQGRSTKTCISFCVVEDRLLQCYTRRTTCVFTGSSPASHQRRCSLRCQSPTSRPCQPCSARSTLALNPWANIIQGVSHDVQHRQWNSADIHDWHGHAHLRSPRSVSSSFCRRGTVWRASHSDCVWFQGFFNRWPSGLEWSPCPRSSHSYKHICIAK